MTTTTYDIDIDCSFCFDDVILALRAEPTVTDIRGSIAAGCLAVTHDTDADRLAAIIAEVGHRLLVAGNAEIVQAGAHATAVRACDRHP